ncbi:gamma-glutamyl-gamma-aminobutyrate hydrolase family protein [Dickeya zeae]|jgi:putative glutamine amidotransferase|uniref:gamma-glutamyl-gamma-aminobutyrate hydrolase family protein n=1 Tax=Dickeya zeae TaxID=204042 RepID=UPI0005766560|nr:gamma-glutamyl-gamma-aminobutyrate hydrolase family protein [Dickeya zeae]
MKHVAITMMRLYEPSRQEWRDALDQRWLSLMQTCGLIPLYLPNDADLAEKILLLSQPEGVIFSGGGDCYAISGEQDARDLTEARALEWAIKYSKPIYGVCRGMQAVLSHFGGAIIPVTGHVATRHKISIHDNEIDTEIEVNSFHNYGFRHIPEGFTVTSKTADGSIESVSDRKRKIHLIMWHPERENIAMPHDVKIIKNIFGAE